MYTRPLASNQEALLQALEMAEDLGLLSPETALAARRSLTQTPSRANAVTRLLRSSGLLASQLRALTRLGLSVDSGASGTKDAAERIADGILREREDWKATIAQGVDAPADAEHPQSYPRWIGIAAAVLFLAIYIPLLRSRERRADAAEDRRQPSEARDHEADREAADAQPPAPESKPARRIPLPTDEEMIEKYLEDTRSAASDGPAPR